jgi:DNA polymerase-3 subunit beta
MEIDNGAIKMVSVDGFRVSFRKYDFESGEKDVKVIIPGKTLNEIGKILPADADALVSIHTTDKHILFDLENCIIVSRLLDGTFINYENMFTKEADTLITVDRVGLLECIERAALVSRDAKRGPVKLKIEDGKVVITSSAEVGTSYEEISAEQNGPGLELGFQSRYITDTLRVLECETITMEFTTPLSPCIIKVQDSDDYRYLAMPYRIRN